MKICFININSIILLDAMFHYLLNKSLINFDYNCKEMEYRNQEPFACNLYFTKTTLYCKSCNWFDIWHCPIYQFFSTFNKSDGNCKKLKTCYSTYRSQLLDNIDIIFIFLDFLSKTNGLFHFSWVDILWPTTFNMVDATAFCLKPFCVYLQNDNDKCAMPEEWSCHHHDQLGLATILNFGSAS